MRFSLFALTLVCFTDILGTVIALGDQYRLECLTDYISNVTCSLNISVESPDNKPPYWLHFNMTEEHFNCTLERRGQSSVCMLKLPSDFIFTDTDSYKISLRSGYHGNNFSIVLDDSYMPKNHIRPVVPCNLSLLWDQEAAVVQWESGYDTERLIVKHLQYQLRMYSKQSPVLLSLKPTNKLSNRDHVQIYEVVVMEQKVLVEESRFKPHANYTIHVRSKPGDEHYKGVWSQWTPALHWRSGNINKGSPESSSHTTRYLLLVPLSLVLLLCISYSRCRKQEYVPSPASYLKDWKVDTQIHKLLSGKVRDTLQQEEFLQIDILTENEDKPPQQSTLVYETSGMTSEHEPSPQSPSMLHSPEGSEVDSGCWIRDFMATERGSIICSEDYCTLSHSQQIYSS